MTILELVNLQVLILGGSMDSDYAALAELPPSKMPYPWEIMKNLNE